MDSPRRTLVTYSPASQRGLARGNDPFEFTAGDAWRLLVRELSAFGVVGAVCFVLDLGLFQLLYVHTGLGAVTRQAGLDR